MPPPVPGGRIQTVRGSSLSEAVLQSCVKMRCWYSQEGTRGGVGRSSHWMGVCVYSCVHVYVFSLNSRLKAAALILLTSEVMDGPVAAGGVNPALKTSSTTVPSPEEDAMMSQIIQNPCEALP